MRVRARNFSQGLLHPEPFLGEFPVSGTWTHGTLICLSANGSVPAGSAPGGAFTVDVPEEAKTSGMVQSNEWTAVRQRAFYMCSGAQQEYMVHRRTHSFLNLQLGVGVDPSGRLAKQATGPPELRALALAVSHPPMRWCTFTKR
eukprot:6013623-Amphidinium_carterae.1